MTRRPAIPVRRLLLLLAFSATVFVGIRLTDISRLALGVVVRACTVNFDLTSSPFPCTKVVPGAAGQAGYIVLNEPMHRSRTILAPITNLPGIEDAALLAPDAPNYFELAWKERRTATADRHADLTRDALGLAINSQQARTQDHLHIHMACVRSSVHAALQKHAPAIGEDRFRKLSFHLRGVHYWAKAIPTREISWNPFHDVAEGIPRAAADLGNVSIAVIGAILPGNVKGFYVLADLSNPRRNHEAAAERLLDPTCTL
jgi:CDP-diacylglycerol pyrophosphatase